MLSLLRTAGAAFLLIAILSATGPAARAEEGCDNIVQYLWDFQPGMEPAAEQDWDKLSSLNTKLHKGLHRLAAPGSVDASIAYPFPAMPSVVSSTLDRDTLTKVKGLYDRYVLLERSIEDTWKDRYAASATSTTMQKFSSERGSTIQEMNHVAKSAKDEVVRFAFRSHTCFDSYEAYVMGQHKELKQQLANTQATLKTNEEIWAHTGAPPVVEVPALAPMPQTASISGAKGPAEIKVENLDAKRSPASATMPAIVPEGR